MAECSVVLMIYDQWMFIHQLYDDLVDKESADDKFLLCSIS